MQSLSPVQPGSNIKDLPASFVMAIPYRKLVIFSVKAGFALATESQS